MHVLEHIIPVEVFVDSGSTSGVMAAMQKDKRTTRHSEHIIQRNEYRVYMTEVYI